MSIVGQAAGGETIQYLFLTALTLGGLLVAAWRGLFRRDAVLGPERVPSGQHTWPVLLMLLAGATLWLGAQTGLGVYKQAEWTRTGHTGHFDLSTLTPGDYAFLATVPGAAGAAVILAIYFLLPRTTRPRLGLEPSRIPAGILYGLLSILLILPIVLWAGAITEAFYNLIHFEHPAEHDLLKLMGQADNPLITITLIFGAVVIAPLVEEMLFRGLFQTLLVWAFNRRPLAAAIPAAELAAPDAPTAGAVAAPPLPDADPAPSTVAIAYATPVVAPLSEEARSRRLSRGRWAAILVSSIFFAAVHPAWSIPPIFVLAICLGFAYERSGNLWLNITVHSLFNAFQTAFYLIAVAHK